MKKSAKSPRRTSSSPAVAAPPSYLDSQLRGLSEVWNLAVTAVRRDRRPLDRVLSELWRTRRCFGSRDRKLFGETIYATFRYWGWLAKTLHRENRRAVENGDPERMEPAAAAALLLAAWCLTGQPWPDALLYLAKSRRLPLPVAENLRGDTRELIPAWAAELLPEARRSYCDALAQRPPMWLRGQGIAPEALAARLKSEGLRVVPHRRIANAFAATDAKVNLFTVPAYRDGLFEVQDLASQVIALVAAPQPGERWWDACAGAGGKTLALAEAMRRKGSVVASDIRAYKLDDLRQRARRAQFPNIMTKVWDGKALELRQRAKFDGVLVDAPCSCSGVWRRNPDGRWSTDRGEVEAMAKLQLEILTMAAAAVKPGGVLVYATCSVFPIENEQVVAAFLAQSPGFVRECFASPLDGTRCDGVLNVDSFSEACDGMFVARFRAQAETQREDVTGI